MQRTDVDHLIIGAGFAGLCTAIKLQEAGETDFLVIEKDDDVGGTWHANTYPGAACDVPSQLYSFSFALNPEWSAAYSPQPEILAYLRRVAADSGTLDRFRLGTEVLDARWDAGLGRWIVTSTAGEYAARTLIAGAGGLSEPRLPEIEGIGSFAGPVFHTARWDHDVELAGRRVAVIGTGASAIQAVPELRKVAARVDVYQRTPNWVIPRNERRTSDLEKRLFRRVPAVQRAVRAGVYTALEARVPAFVRFPRLQALTEAAAKANIRRGITDPALRAAVTPDYRAGCKRILISNAWYPALAADNVELVTTRIDRITPGGIVDADGTHREVDVLVIATGFHVTDPPIAERITGRDGRTLAEVWTETGMRAYKGTTIHGFPNLFQLVGPNTALGHSSMVFIIESQVRYVVDAVDALRRSGWAPVEPTPAAQEAWNEHVQERMGSTVWTTGGCASWYLDRFGNNTTLWPGHTFTFRRHLARFDRGAYQVVDPAPAVQSDTPPGAQPGTEKESVTA
ncbi:NAD(P)/FAD-dependent oxidoreductase [Nocardioides sp. GY 10113]|uniref:flavin-containing monooxygenase n=1 Tax=Nocardioides sp. GY 10113 TaxID=2569761 RepID=UPI0010A8F6DE|nr:NAD(P)/FAD-dependent oxidoreductase [Nocardioides sp. GY 10113]TIC85895.1 NAD(P)/FAD-dependent oxidoreductase [Nocardioides sp. GY 10113]